MKHNIYIAERKEKSVLLLCMAEAAGIVTGGCLCAFGGGNDLGRYLTPLLFGGDLMDVFHCSFLSLSIYLFAAFTAGLFALGQPLGIGLIIAKGAELGCTAAMIYTEKGISAVPAVLALLLPYAAAVSLVSLVAAREVMRTSGALLRTMTHADVDGEVPSMKMYCVKYLILTAAAFIISVGQTMLNYIFGGLLK